MAPELAILDNGDPAIIYAGQWVAGNISLDFQGSITNTAVSGATASLSFTGTSVNVYGTVNPNNAGSTTLTETYSFVVDGDASSQRLYTPPTTPSLDIRRHTQFYQSPPLANTEHTLNITVVAAQGRGVMFLDYITFETTSPAAAQTYLVDDRDARVVYHPTNAWSLSDSTDDMMQTSQMGTSPGAGFTLDFQGRGIEYWGAVPAGGDTHINLSIDGGQPTPFIPKPIPASLTRNTLIFRSGDLVDGNHTLDATAQGQSQIYVDFFLVTPSLRAGMGSDDKPPTTASSADTSGKVPPVTANESSATSSTSSQDSRPPPHIPVIVGAVLGGAAVVLLGGLLLWFGRRFRRRKTMSGTGRNRRVIGSHSNRRSIEPFPQREVGEMRANPDTRAWGGPVRSGQSRKSRLFIGTRSGGGSSLEGSAIESPQGDLSEQSRYAPSVAPPSYFE